MFSVLFKLRWFFKKYWKRYTFAIIALIIVSIIDLVPPKLVGIAIDEIQFNTLTVERLIELLLIYSGLLIVSYCISYLWDYTLFSGAMIMEKTMRTRLMNHFLRMTPTFFGKNRTGDLMARATNDLKALTMTAGFGILTLVDSTIFMLMIIAVMGVTISWPLTFAALIPLPVMALIMNRYGQVIHKRFTEAQESFGEMNNQVLESIRGVRVIRAFVQEKNDEASFNEMTEDVYDKNIQVAKVDALFEPTIKVLVGLSYTIGLGYGANLVFKNQITLGEMVSFNVYLGMLIWPMFAVGELINVLQRGNASLDRVQSTLNYKPDVVNPAPSISLDKPGEIVFHDLSFQYPETKTYSLKNIDLVVKQGETIGIVGKTGAGKTTFFRQLLREYPGTEGRLKMNGIPIENLSLDQTRAWIGYVPQDQVLFSKTVRENIQFGKPGATDEEIYRVLELAHLLEDMKHLPDGLDTKLGESGVTLSGGQKQRISIARAFVMSPEILLLDDAMSAVDGKTEAEILNHLRRERKGKTTFIAAHRLSAVTHADQILVLDGGSIVEQGIHEELAQNGGWYQSQYEHQQLKDRGRGR
ncbi:ABC transporter ATP-binding protein [Halobacillus karajensis]|uniref:Multidrug resistance ABC transporter ATP-binding/permease protein YheI n=1 Tax=Halobacillus karajensis TaxID=195088 RepID=A0A024P7C1_9BACI|nr:ABC transporter transmembrane domain-containing protein [Halobacillus karajensis]CDQ21176.1 putative multidrug resistance ABC transporter ATP-binding/permease protein YheI [Halobacillus karajensis]CDQ24760.1 putative multidrug resistance ABC transporter ATP-binding/permease protein YheI [Halobacillus karajensis]CDQ28880.1 putative multidrug resistance ABC transporter ATP-binding/permease protein YheI [Halobacillus karajensis]